MEIVDIKITKKTGTREEGYRYEGKITLSEDEGYWKKYLLFFKRYEKDIRNITHHFRANNSCLYLDDCWTYDARYDSPSGNTHYLKILLEVFNLGTNIKSEDECCINPDLVEGHWYYKYDILLGYLLNRADTEIIDHEFLNSFWCIKFKCRNHEFTCTGGSLTKFGYSDKVYQKACLNCKTCDNSEEENFIKEFDKWLEDEYNKKQREEMAKNICCEEV